MSKSDRFSVKQIAVKDLIEYAGNPRDNDGAVDAVAESISRFGFRVPIIVDKDGVIIAGHTRLKAALKLGLEKVPVHTAADLTPRQARELRIADNKVSELAEWDMEALADELAAIYDDGGDMDGVGFTASELADLICDDCGGQTDEDAIPEPPAKPISKLGKVYRLGNHRLMCGDSTSVEDVGLLMDGVKAVLVHADPPYGMGKEGEGVENDNLYRDKLDSFQMGWWRAFRPYVEDNGSAYIWGNAEDLWRLWYIGWMKSSERLTLRNEVVWDKGHGEGMKSDAHRMYPTATERALFFMLGEQGFNNNADNYWDGWDSVVNYLRAEKEKTGWDIATFKRLAGHSETSGCHWFDKSQWSFPTKEVYESWQAAAREHDAFKREHDDLKREHDDLKREHDDLKREFYETRAYFDNAHDNMTDVWSYPRVIGEERHGHATPKPVDMTARCLISSSPEGSITVEPFLGSGTTIIAAEKTSRVCYGMEITPAYCDVIRQRWAEFVHGEGCNWKKLTPEVK